MKKWIVASIATLALSAVLVGQGKTPILQPQMTPVGDPTYKKAMGKMGEKAEG